MFRNTVLLSFFTTLHIILSHCASVTDNAGTYIGIAGKGFCLLASDSNLCDQNKIMTQSLTRQLQVAPGCVFISSGNQADSFELGKALKFHARTYAFESNIDIPVKALSHVVSHELYNRRFSPYYSFCALGGLDSAGNGALYRYDPLGSSERVVAVCAGRGEKMMTPLLDEAVSATAVNDDGDDNCSAALWRISASGASFESVARSQHQYCTGMTEDVACELAVRAFRAARQRETSVGESIEIWLLRHTEAAADGYDPVVQANAPIDGGDTTAVGGSSRLQIHPDKFATRLPRMAPKLIKRMVKL